MAALKDVIVYFCKMSKNTEGLSKARLAKLIYLADWKSCILHGRQITSLAWKFNHYGPYVNDIKELVMSSEETFNINSSFTMFGAPKEVISLKNQSLGFDLTSDEKSILENVLRATEGKNFDQFIKLVYSTYPIVTQERHSHLDLPRLAKEYKESETLLSDPLT